MRVFVQAGALLLAAEVSVSRGEREPAVRRRGSTLPVVLHIWDDAAGTIAAAANFILADLSPLGFIGFRSADLGVTGDWVVRASISQVAPQIPLLPMWGVAALGALTLATGGTRFRRRRTTPGNLRGS
jgi:hypothetical protein